MRKKQLTNARFGVIPKRIHTLFPPITVCPVSNKLLTFPLIFPPASRATYFATNPFDTMYTVSRHEMHHTTDLAKISILERGLIVHFFLNLASRYRYTNSKSFILNCSETDCSAVTQYSEKICSRIFEPSPFIVHVNVKKCSRKNELLIWHIVCFVFFVFFIKPCLFSGGAYWIGVTDANNEGQYKYASDGTNLTITPWGHHEGGHDNAEDCVELDFRTGKHGEWADYPCGAQKYFVCEQLQGYDFR